MRDISHSDVDCLRLSPNQRLIRARRKVSSQPNYHAPVLKPVLARGILELPACQHHRRYQALAVPFLIFLLKMS